MAAPVQLRWKGPQAPRAKPIAPEEWKKHKAQLFFLHRTKTLEEIMQIMVAMHGFAPSRRQYISQFQKWGLFKYNTARVATQAAPTPNPATSDPQPEACKSPYEQVDGDVDTSKRHRSQQSLSSEGSASSKPLVPPKKRAKLESFLASRGPYADLGIAFDQPMGNDVQDATREVSNTLSMGGTPVLSSRALEKRPANRPRPGWALPPLQTTDLTPMKHPNGSSETQDTEMHDYLDSPGFHADDPFTDSNASTPTRAGPSTRVGNHFTPEQYSDSDWETVDDPFRETPRDDVQPDVEMEDVYAASIISTVETPSSHDRTGSQFSLPGRWASVEDITRFARNIDLNQPIDNFTDEQIADMKRAADYLQALYYDEDACYLYALVIKRYQGERRVQGRSAFAIAIDYAQTAISTTHCEIVQNLLNTELGNNPSPLTVFLSHMMLAHTYARLQQDATAAKHLQDAMAASTANDLIENLPEHDRALDLVTYHNAVRCMSLGSKELTPADVEVLFEAKPDQDAGELQSLILHRIPGPFEIKDRTMQNPCIRSCLQWSKKVLNGVKSIPGVWKTMDSSSGLISCAETIAIFTFLWDQSQNPITSNDDRSFTLWITETQERMGISPTYLLNLLCRMTFFPEYWRRANNSVQLVKNMQRRFTTLLRLSDPELAILFLERYAKSNCLSGWSSDRQVFQEVARDHVLEMLRRVLMVIPPGFRGTEWISAAEAATPRQMFTNPLPTLAPALDSLSLLRMQLLESVSSLSLNARQHISNLPFNQSSQPVAESPSMSERRRDSASVSSQSSAFGWSVRDACESIYAEPLIRLAVR